MRPLADEIRPQTLDEVAGQKHLLGEGALLRRLIENGAEANLIFYGPSGTGKTTIANIIAKRTQKALYHLNATTAGLSDIKAIIADVDTMMAPNGICCIWMRSSTSTRSSSRACWSSWRTARSP